MNSQKTGDGQLSRVITTQESSPSTSSSGQQQQQHPTPGSSFIHCSSSNVRQQHHAVHHGDAADQQPQRAEKRRQPGGHGDTSLLAGLINIGNSLGGSGRQQPHLVPNTNPLQQWSDHRGLSTTEFVGFANPDGIERFLTMYSLSLLSIIAGNGCYANTGVCGILGQGSFGYFCQAHTGNNPIVLELMRIQAGLFVRPNNSCTRLRSLVLPSDGIGWGTSDGQRDTGDFLSALLKTLHQHEVDGGLGLDNVLCLEKQTFAQCQHCTSFKINISTERWMVSIVPMSDTLDTSFNMSMAPGRSFKEYCQCSSSPGQLRTFQEQSCVERCVDILLCICDACC